MPNAKSGRPFQCNVSESKNACLSSVPSVQFPSTTVSGISSAAPTTAEILGSDWLRSRSFDEVRLPCSLGPIQRPRARKAAKMMPFPAVVSPGSSWRDRVVAGSPDSRRHPRGCSVPTSFAIRHPRRSFITLLSVTPSPSRPLRIVAPSFRSLTFLSSWRLSRSMACSLWPRWALRPSPPTR